MIRNKSEVALIVTLLVVVVFGVVGWLVTPKDEKGQPILLLPDVKSVEDYRRKAKDWTEEFGLLDGRLAVLLSGNSKSLYSQSRNSQELFSDYVKLAQKIENTEAPAALTGLKDMLANTSVAYLTACQSALVWVSNDSEENLVSTETLVNDAQQYMKELENSTWTN